MGESLPAVARDVAVGYRVAIGRSNGSFTVRWPSAAIARYWDTIFRRKPSSARFDRRGEVEPLLEIE